MEVNYESLTNMQLFDLSQREGINLSPMRKWLINSLNQNRDIKTNTDYYILVENSKGDRLRRPNDSFVDYEAKGDATIGDIRLAISKEMRKNLDDVQFVDVRGSQKIGNVIVSGVNVGGKNMDVKQVAGKDLSDNRRISEFYPFNQLTFKLKESFFKKFF